MVLWPALALGQVTSAPGVELRDEGASQGLVQKLDCVGSAIACSKSGVVGTLSITSGAPVDATYITQTPDPTLTSEQALSLLSNGLMFNSAGVVSIYGGTSCTNQVVRVLSSSGVATCVTITSSYTSGTFPADSHGLLSSTHSDTTSSSPVRGSIVVADATPVWTRLPLGAANRYLKSNGTDLVYSSLAAPGTGSCTNQFVRGLNADASPTCATVTSSDVDGSLVPSTRTISTVAPLTGGGDLSANRTLSTSMNTNRLIGRTTTGTGVMEEISVAAPLTLGSLTLGFDSAAALNNNARVAVRRNTGATVGTRRRLNLIEGANVTLTVSDDSVDEEVDVTISAASAYQTVQDEGTPLTQRSTLNFTGAGVTCSDTGSLTTCDIPGGGGGGGGLSHPQVMARLSLGF